MVTFASLLEAAEDVSLKERKVSGFQTKVSIQISIRKDMK